MHKIKLNQPTIALFVEEGRQVAHTVPAGTILEAETTEGNGLVGVRWSEKTVMMFAQDIRARGEELEPSDSGGD